MALLKWGERQWPVAEGENLLEALLAGGAPVAHGCRAGSCQACLVRCLAGEPEDECPEALAADQRRDGWRLACQCRVTGDLQVAVPDWRQDGVRARVLSCEWRAGEVLRLHLQPERPLRYRAGQHLLLATEAGIARPYSLASLPGEDAALEFHLACARPGAFAEAARHLAPGDVLHLGPPAGALHYDPGWAERPLLLLARGTGLAPLWGVLREALRQGHAAPIRLVHLAPAGAHYLAAELDALAEAHPSLALEYLAGDDWPAPARLARQTQVLVCGAPGFVEGCGKRLFMAGVPRGQVLGEAFAVRREA